MRVLVTGHDGYIGSVLAPMLREAGHDVVGLDTFFYEGCDFGEAPRLEPALRLDIRDVGPGRLEGFDAVVHLAALSNDPLGDLDPAWTYAINFEGTISWPAPRGRPASPASSSRRLAACTARLATTRLFARMLRCGR